jgi:hypothetical protein
MLPFNKSKHFILLLKLAFALRLGTHIRFHNCLNTTNDNMRLRVCLHQLSCVMHVWEFKKFGFEISDFLCIFS